MMSSGKVKRGYILLYEQYVHDCYMYFCLMIANMNMGHVPNVGALGHLLNGQFSLNSNIFVSE